MNLKMTQLYYYILYNNNSMFDKDLIPESIRNDVGF